MPGLIRLLGLARGAKSASGIQTALPDTGRPREARSALSPDMPLRSSLAHPLLLPKGRDPR